MGRTPCCEKMGLKKGPWTPEEDRILISYIHQHGHHNWRALPKQAGLLRCGKSCRLRWINYLRPDIKRGNFTQEEEETIISLHQILGNRWSAIAARLPGRTDNEIKNFWNTHLRKKLHDQKTNYPSPTSMETTNKHFYSSIGISIPNTPMDTENQRTQSFKHMVQSQVEESHAQAQPSSISAATEEMHTLLVMEEDHEGNNNNVVASSRSLISSTSTRNNVGGKIFLPKKSPTVLDSSSTSLLLDNFMNNNNNNNNNNEDMDFWYDLFVKAGDDHQACMEMHSFATP